MKGILGLIFSNMHDHMISELTALRCMGSIPVGGRYRLIDFILSSFVNAGVEEVGVITKSNYQSLIDHLGTGREWDLSRKNGGLVLLPPFGRVESGGMYRNRIEALTGIMDYLKNNKDPLVLGADCDYMANIDLTDFIESHIESGVDISLIYKRMSLEGELLKEVTTLMLDRDGNVMDMLMFPQISGEQNVYVNIFLMSKELLSRAVTDCYSRNLLSFDRDILQSGVGKYKIRAYEYTGYASRFDSLRGYYKTNLSLLDPGVRKELFPRERPIYTKIRDEAPVRYGLDSNIKNCLLGDGCHVEGEVEDSILFRGVTVEKGARVKGCVVMQGTRIGAGSNLECVITDKNVTISNERTIMGYSTYPVYIGKGSVV